MIMRRILAGVCALILLAVPTVHGEEEVRIAFLDSGISHKHLDGSRIAEGENFVFPSRDTNDRIGHGTATAGVVLGSEELGLKGTCPTAVAVPLVCYDTFPTGEAVPADAEALAAAIRAAVDKYGCRILNISMGCTVGSETLAEAVRYAQSRDVLIVSAVGNENLNDPDRVYYPAMYDGVIGVGATDGWQCAEFSQRSGVDVLAPGVHLPTVTNRNAAKTERKSGTSYACAYISGVCGQILTENPTMTAAEVQSALFDMALDIGEVGYDADSGWGVIKTVSLTDRASMRFWTAAMQGNLAQTLKNARQ